MKNLVYLLFGLAMTSSLLFVLPVQAKTHCFVVIGEGKNFDPLYQVASLLLRSAPLKGNCIQFNTWNELNSHYQQTESTYDVSDQFFIAQPVHGSPGGRAWDREGVFSIEQYQDGIP